jgi:16S rRNA (guanine1516-N2)-methyltransferase
MNIYYDESISIELRAIAEKNNWQVFTNQTDGMLLTLYNEQLAVKDLSEPKWTPLSIDFLEPLWLKRFQKVHNETQLIKRAIGMPPSENILVWDATAGLGRDAMVLASLGYRVISVERSAAVYSLLKDAYERALHSEELKEILPRLTFIFGDSKELLENLTEVERPEIIYLDPMYPTSKKSAQPRKEMQILRKILGSDENLKELLAIAKKTATKKVIVKNNPRAGEKPKHSLESKSVRLDIF